MIVHALFVIIIHRPPTSRQFGQFHYRVTLDQWEWKVFLGPWVCRVLVLMCQTVFMWTNREVTPWPVVIHQFLQLPRFWLRWGVFGVFSVVSVFSVVNSQKKQIKLLSWERYFLGIRNFTLGNFFKSEWSAWSSSRFLYSQIPKEKLRCLKLHSWEEDHESEAVPRLWIVMVNASTSILSTAWGEWSVQQHLWIKASAKPWVKWIENPKYARVGDSPGIQYLIFFLKNLLSTRLFLNHSIPC